MTTTNQIATKTTTTTATTIMMLFMLLLLLQIHGTRSVLIPGDRLKNFPPHFTRTLRFPGNRGRGEVRVPHGSNGLPFNVRVYAMVTHEPTKATKTTTTTTQILTVSPTATIPQKTNVTLSSGTKTTTTTKTTIAPPPTHETTTETRSPQWTTAIPPQKASPPQKATPETLIYEGTGGLMNDGRNRDTDPATGLIFGYDETIVRIWTPKYGHIVPPRGTRGGGGRGQGDVTVVVEVWRSGPTASFELVRHLDFVSCAEFNFTHSLQVS